MLAAVVQMHATSDRDANLATAESLIAEAKQAGAGLVVLPEMVDYQGPGDAVPEIATTVPGEVTDIFSGHARKHGVWLLAGSIHERVDSDSRTYNTSTLFSPEGDLVAAYRKIHLYDVDMPGRVSVKESDTIAPGDAVVTADIAGHTAGLTICYDIRFPELYRALADAGAELVFLPAAFMQFTGKDHWEPLIRARAIENQCFMLASGQQGIDHLGRATYGRSMIVDPWGTVLATAPDGQGFAMAWLDFDALRRIREELPSLANRRPDLFTR